MAHLRYISRPDAVREGREGTLLFGLPSDVTEADSYHNLRTNLLSYAWMRETVETARAAKGRAHYRALLSFERDAANSQARGLIQDWLTQCFPAARAAAFFHRNTAHLHAHVWIEARQKDGRKIHLDARQYRRLDEVWNRLYCRAMGREEREHLDKKRENRRGRGGAQRQTRPARQDRTGERAMYHDREIRGAGGYELEKGGTGSHQPAPAGGPADGERGERLAASGEPAFERLLERYRRAARSVDAAVSETLRLRDAAARLGRSERKREIERAG